MGWLNLVRQDGSANPSALLYAGELAAEQLYELLGSLFALCARFHFRPADAVLSQQRRLRRNCVQTEQLNSLSIAKLQLEIRSIGAGCQTDSNGFKWIRIYLSIRGLITSPPIIDFHCIF